MKNILPMALLGITASISSIENAHAEPYVPTTPEEMYLIEAQKNVKIALQFSPDAPTQCDTEEDYEKYIEKHHSRISIKLAERMLQERASYTENPEIIPLDHYVLNYEPFNVWAFYCDYADGTPYPYPGKEDETIETIARRVFIVGQSFLEKP